MMPGSCRQFTKTHGAQFATQRLLADRDAEFVKHPLRQVDQPPADHAVNRREWTALDDPVQRLPLLIVEQWRVARCLTIHQAGWPLGVESQHPVPHRLQPDTADLGGLGARPAVIDRRQRQQAPGLSGILRPLRQHAYLRGLVIPANSNRSRHGKLPRVCHGESYSPRLGNPLRESRSRGLGISDYRTTVPPNACAKAWASPSSSKSTRKTVA